MLGTEEGEISTVTIDPYLVRLRMPDCGFGNRLDTIVQFYLEHGEELRAGWMFGHSKREVWILFCFRRLENATKFAQLFSGVILEASSDDESFFP